MVACVSSGMKRVGRNDTYPGENAVCCLLGCGPSPLPHRNLQAHYFPHERDCLPLMSFTCSARSNHNTIDRLFLPYTTVNGCSDSAERFGAFHRCVAGVCAVCAGSSASVLSCERQY